MKVIFLDIDGVLNSGDNQCSYGFLKNCSGSDKYGDLFDDRCVRYLQAIVEKTGAYIVMSSSWRHSGMLKMAQMWEDRKLPGKLIDVTPSWKHDAMTGGISKCYDCRGEEIQEWINSAKPEKYIIIDDDSDMLDEQMQYFIKTDGMIGITIDHAKRAVELLGEL